MNNKEKEQWLREAYNYTRDFDFRRLDKYEDANEDLHIDDLILDYTLLYEFYKERTKKLQKENKRLNNIINELEKELKEGSFDVYFCSKSSQKTFKSNEMIIKAMLLDKLKELKGE